MFVSDAAVLAFLDTADLALIPSHTVVCVDDGSVVALTAGPWGRCTCCEALTVWIDAAECAHLCLDCQGDLSWSLPWPVEYLRADA